MTLPTVGGSSGGERRAYVLRLGKSVLADEAFYAWTSRDLSKMVRALGVPTNPIDRHFLLQGLIQESYKRRADPAMRALCIRVGRTHVQEFPSIAPVLSKEMGGRLPLVPALKFTVMALVEAREYNEAEVVCQLAAHYGVRDGTKGGFSARLKRIEKLRQAASLDPGTPPTGF